MKKGSGTNCAQHPSGRSGNWYPTPFSNATPFSNVLGFSEPALYAYATIVVVQATFIHANVRWEFPGFRWLLATPHFYHWHHAAEPQAIDKNFAVHTRLWDWLFGTLLMPDRWPDEYGICGKKDVPSSWLLQFLYPFRRRPAPDKDQSIES